MAKDKVYVGSIGTEIIVDAELALTGATVSLLVLKPGGVEVPWAGTVYTLDGEARYVRHTTADGDLDVPGDYRVQPQVLAADGSWEIPGATGKFHVFNKFE